MPLRVLRPRTREQAMNLWMFVGTVLAVVTAWIGGGYAVDGAGLTPGNSSYILRHDVPGGVHTTGVVLLLAALGMVYTVLTPFDRHSTWTLRCFAGVAFLVGLSLAGSWFITHSIGWAGPVLWWGVGALAEGMVVFPPNSLPVEDKTDAPADLHGSGLGA